jgi:hypothetical protein
MRAHLFVDGGGMVTGTHDIKEARRLIVDHAMDNGLGDFDNREDLAYFSAQFRPHQARLETGRIVPVGNMEYHSEYSWFWRSGYKLGKPGVTRAVVWS